MLEPDRMLVLRAEAAALLAGGDAPPNSGAERYLSSLTPRLDRNANRSLWCEGVASTHRGRRAAVAAFWVLLVLAVVSAAALVAAGAYDTALAAASGFGLTATLVAVGAFGRTTCAADPAPFTGAQRLRTWNGHARHVNRVGPRHAGVVGTRSSKRTVASPAYVHAATVHALYANAADFPLPPPVYTDTYHKPTHSNDWGG